MRVVAGSLPYVSKSYQRKVSGSFNGKVLCTQSNVICEAPTVEPHLDASFTPFVDDNGRRCLHAV
jgi:hypothetical protein